MLFLQRAWPFQNEFFYVTSAQGTQSTAESGVSVSTEERRKENNARYRFFQFVMPSQWWSLAGPSTCLQQAGFFPDLLTLSSLSLSMGTSLLFLSFLCLYSIQGQRDEWFLVFVVIYPADVSLKPKLPLYQTLLVYWMMSVHAKLGGPEAPLQADSQKPAEGSPTTDAVTSPIYFLVSSSHVW